MSITRKRIFITVKTYPNPSASYVETVCTAGIVENEGWIRLYPVPFRVSSSLRDKQFSKYQWISVDVSKRPPPDYRPESFSPQTGTLELGEFIPPSSDARKDIIFGNTRLYDDLDEIIALAKQFKMSIATFRPSEIIDFYAIERIPREWTREEQLKLDSEITHGDFFIDETYSSSNLRKVPFKFIFRFKDSKGRISNLMIEDWEVGMCFWNMLESSATEAEAVRKVIDKYTKIWQEEDCTFFLGTTNKFQNMSAPNPFVIIGLFHSKRSPQMLLPF